MLKFVFLVLCLVLLASSQEVQPLEAQVLQDQIVDTANNLPTKYCPMRNFNGQLFCPTVKGLNEVEGTSVQSQYTVTVDLDAPKVQNNDVADIESAEDPTNQEEVYVPHEVNNQTVEMMYNTRTVISGTGFDRIKREIRFPGKKIKKIKNKFWNQETEWQTPKKLTPLQKFSWEFKIFCNSFTKILKLKQLGKLVSM
jgi:hypothetical protein